VGKQSSPLRQNVSQTRSAKNFPLFDFSGKLRMVVGERPGADVPRFRESGLSREEPLTEGCGRKGRLEKSKWTRNSQISEIYKSRLDLLANIRQKKRGPRFFEIGGVGGLILNQPNYAPQVVRCNLSGWIRSGIWNNFALVAFSGRSNLGLAEFETRAARSRL